MARTAAQRNGVRQRRQREQQLLSDEDVLEDDPLEANEDEAEEEAEGIADLRRNTKPSEADKSVASVVAVAVVLSVVAFAVFVAADNVDSVWTSRALGALGTALAVTAVLLTYGVAGRRKHKTREDSSWSFFQPLKGGVRFVALQIVGWIFFTFSVVLPCVPVIAGVFYPKLALTGVVVCAGVSGVVSQILMIASLLTYEDPKAQRKHKRRLSAVDTFVISASGEKWWSSFLGLVGILGPVGCGIAFFADMYTKHHHLGLFMLFFASACVILSVLLTYGLGGSWKHGRGWKFFQPFSGGIVFVVLQALSWTFFAVSLAIFLVRLHLMLCQVSSYNLCMDSIVPYNTLQDAPSLLTASLLGLLAQVLSASSLLTFKQPGEALPAPKHEEKPLSFFQNVAMVLVVIIFYNLEKILIALLVSSVAISTWAPHAVLAGWILFILLYLPTFKGRPSSSGHRNIPGSRGNFLFDYFERYFQLQILKSDKQLDPEHQYIFGYHPHGVLPLTCAWSVMTKQFLSRFPGINPAPLSSSVIHYVPIMRDACQLTGGMEVTRKGFKNGLRDRKSVILVPGGQIEMIESRSEDSDVIVKTNHKGFVRVGLEVAAEPGRTEDCHLVPVYSFGETLIFDNIRAPASLQYFCVRVLRANVIFMPYGSFFLPGIPRAVRVSLACADPIKIPVVEGSITDEHVDLLHRLYFTELANAFDEHKAAAGHEEDTIVLDPPIEPLTREEFARKFAAVPRSDEAPRKPRPESHVEELWLGMIVSATFAYVVYLSVTSPNFSWTF